VHPTDCIKLQVDALAPDDPVVVMPCLTVLRTLQPVFFDNLKAGTKVRSYIILSHVASNFLLRSLLCGISIIYLHILIGESREYITS
jgi:hypothetical protein